ncbi:MAG TPA: hypothetical protein VK147_03370 [Candidatus Didemnitutus sp.]|nr:hypothetical protein [Candidatus Didemnitutus sp.]
MRIFVFVLALYCTFSLTPDSLAQTWTPISSPIYGGRLDEIVADDDGTLYGNVGLFVVRSTDKGLTWTAIPPRSPLGIEDMSMDARVAIIRGPFNVKIVAVYPTDGDFTEIYTTFDGGTTWTTSQVPVEFQGAELFVVGLRSGKGLAFARSTNSTVVLATSDGGQTWSLETGFIDMPRGIHETTEGVTYVADNDELIRRRSTDGQWTIIPLPEAGTPIQNICTAGTRLYLVSLDSVYSTTNNGATWTSTTFDSPVTTFYPRQIVGFPDGGAVLFSQYDESHTAIFRLKNDSLVWSTRQDSLPIPVRRPISFGENNIIFPGDAGPFFSDTWGSEWDFRTQGIRLQPIWRFAIQGASIIAVSFGGDIYRGSIDGTSWDLIADRPAVAGDFPLLDVVGIAPSTYLINSSIGMMRSVDDGNSWSVVSGTEGMQYQLNLCKRRNGAVVVTTRNDVLQSLDLGLTWTPIVSVDDSIRLSGISESANGTLYVAAGQTLYRVDGSSLAPLRRLDVPVGFAVTSASNADVFGVVGGNENDGRLEFAVTTNGGTTWVTGTYDIPNGLEPPLLDAVVTNGGHLFVSFPLGLIHMTPNGTVTTEPMTLRSFSVGLELDAEEHLLRSGISVIEKNDQLVSVEDMPVENILRLYPTPARDFVVLSGIKTEDPLQINVFSLNGSLALSEERTPTSGFLELDIRHLTPGVYSIQVGRSGPKLTLVLCR